MSEKPFNEGIAERDIVESPSSYPTFTSSGLFQRAGHFYSPIADVDEPNVKQVATAVLDAELPARKDLAIDDEAMLAMLNQLSVFYPDLCFSEKKTAKHRFYYENGFFSFGDAAVLFSMLRLLKPARVIEVGVGFSSCLMIDVNDIFMGKRMELRFIDPYPEQLLSSLSETDVYCRGIIQAQLQQVPLDVFRQLQANDILFLDSSHVSKPGSDVNDYLFRILPELRAGVVIHIHDIFYPFEYPKIWVLDQNRSWNEAYVVRAFLQYNRDFRILYFNHYLYRRFPELLRELMPMAMRNPGGGLWLQKITD